MAFNPIDHSNEEIVTPIMSLIKPIYDCTDLLIKSDAD